MRFMKEFGIILAVTFVGEVLKKLIPLPIPASIYGLVLMLVVLRTNVIPLESVQKTGKFMIEIMPMMFIPAAVGLLDSWDAIKNIFVPVIIITIVSTIVVMAVTGRATQIIICQEKRKKE